MDYRHRPKCTMCPMLHMCMHSSVCKPNICYPGMMHMYMGQGMQNMVQGMSPMSQSMYPMGMEHMCQKMPSMGEMSEGYPTVVSPEFLPGTTPNYANIPMSEQEECKKKKHHKHEKHHHKNKCNHHGHYSSD